jgi:hypothetical protein
MKYLVLKNYTALVSGSVDNLQIKFVDEVNHLNKMGDIIDTQVFLLDEYKHIHVCNKLCEIGYLINLAEWRNQQIDKILEDD